MIYISCYRNAKDNAGYKKHHSSLAIVDAIRSISYQQRTEKYKALTITDKEKAAWKALNFAGVTWSGTFGTRSTKGLIKHSGLLCVDIDDKEKQSDGSIININDFDTSDKFNAFRESICADPMCHIVFTSPSGSGVKIIIKVEFPDTIITAEDFSHYHKNVLFSNIKRYFRSKYNKDIDQSGCNVDRLCFLPYDPNIYYNQESSTFAVTHVAEAPMLLARANEGYSDSDLDASIDAYVSELINTNTDITANYVNWIKIALAFASLGEDYRDHFNKVSSLHADYDQEQCNYKFSHALSTGSGTVTIKSFFQVCHDHNIKPNVSNDSNATSYKDVYAYVHARNRDGQDISDTLNDKFCLNKYNISEKKYQEIVNKIYTKHKEDHNIANKAEIFAVELFLRDTYDYYLNEVTQRVEFKEKDQIDYYTLNINNVFRALQRSGSKYSIEKLRSLFRSDFVPKINPFVEYFASLPQVSGDVDHIDYLASFVTTTDQEFWRIQFKKALVRMIACAIGKRENRVVMVLVQHEENTGKSTFIRNLNPFPYGHYYTESPLRDGNKDSEFRFSENFIYNLEELSDLSYMDVDKLKAIISRSTIKERRPYGEYEETMERRCSFWASTNKTDFLSGDQNTRWMCFSITSIDHSYKNHVTGLSKVNMDMVWAQAYRLFLAGVEVFDYRITRDEMTHSTEVNKTYQIMSSEKDLILSHYMPCDEAMIGCQYLTASEIMINIDRKNEGRIKLNYIKVGKALVAAKFISKFKKMNGNSTKIYLAKEIIGTEQMSVGNSNEEWPPF